LTPSDGSAGGDFGASLSMTGNTLVVGALAETIANTSNEGAVYVFVRPSSGWRDTTETAKLTASDGNQDEAVGQSVAIHDGTIVAGAGCATVNGNVCQGAAYIFVKPNEGWIDMTESAKITASDGDQLDVFGASVAITSDTIAVGAGGHRSGAGAAYLFIKPVTGWASSVETAELGVLATRPILTGASVAFFGKRLLAGTPFGSIVGKPGVGLLLEYLEPSDGWTNSSRPTFLHSSSDGRAADHFGLSMSASREWIVVGAPYHPVKGHSGQGAAYVLGR